MAKEKLVGIVTVTFNSAAVLPDFLRCVFEQNHRNFLLFAIDNASQDESVAILRSATDERLRIVANCDNKGVAEGNNQGIRASLEAGCTEVLLLNNDTEFGPELLSELLAGLETHSVDMTCPKMLYFDEPNRIWSAGARFVPFSGYLSVCIGENEIDTGQYDQPRLVKDVPTCCALIRASVFDKIGIMDERYFVYLDDTDFMYRAFKAGLKLMYLPHIRLLHKIGRCTGGAESSFTVYYATRNRAYFQFKHLGFIRTLPFLLAREIAWTYKLVRGKKDRAWYRRKQEALIGALRMYRGSEGSSVS